MNEQDRLRLERDRARKAVWRREQGMTPQSDRNVTRRLGEIADRSGVSLSTVKRHRRAGTLDALDKGVTQKCPDSLDQKCPKKSHREVIADLHAGAKAAQDEWLDTLPPWSMRRRNAYNRSKPLRPLQPPGSILPTTRGQTNEDNQDAPPDLQPRSPHKGRPSRPAIGETVSR